MGDREGGIWTLRCGSVVWKTVVHAWERPARLIEHPQPNPDLRAPDTPGEAICFSAYPSPDAPVYPSKRGAYVHLPNGHLPRILVPRRWVFRGEGGEEGNEPESK